MSFIGQKIALPGAGVAFGGEGSAFTPYNSNVFSAAGQFVLPVGDWWIIPNADIELGLDTTGTTALTSVGVITQVIFVRSDGANVGLIATAATTVYYYGPA